MDERRKNDRVPILLDVIWQGGAGKYEARISDISPDRCYIDAI